MEKYFSKLKIVIMDKSLRKKVLFVIGAFFVFRLLAAIPIPGVDQTRLAQFLSNNQFFGILNLFSGGGLSNLSLIMLGVGPYITGSIIMQVLTLISPKLKAMYQEEGDRGRIKFAQISRVITIPLAALQGFALLTILARQGIMTDTSIFSQITNISLVVGGSMLLMWIGELISEFGIGNGVSMIIFSGIVAGLPNHISQMLFTFSAAQIPLYTLFTVVGLLVIAAVVYVTEAQREIPVTYARQGAGGSSMFGSSTYIPLRLNQAGVIPIIFALSILLFPQVIANFLQGSSHQILVSIASGLTWFVNNTTLYSIVYFVLVVVFTYFYTAVTFDPIKLSENLQKNGAFIPGIRPGEPTAKYISRILTRITLFGAVFLGIIAILPLVIKQATGITSVALGGTAILIVVSVVIDLLNKIDAQISMREY